MGADVGEHSDLSHAVAHRDHGSADQCDCDVAAQLAELIRPAERQPPLTQDPVGFSGVDHRVEVVARRK